MPTYKKFYQIDLRTLLPFNEAPSMLPGEVHVNDNEELRIRGRARFQLQDWYNLGARTPLLSPHSFEVSVTSNPRASIGAYSFGLVAEGRPSINISHFLRSSVSLNVEDIETNFLSGFGFDDTSQDYDNHEGRTQRGIGAPYYPQDDHYILSLGYNEDEQLLWCSFNGFRLHEIRAQLGIFHIELCLEAVGVEGEFDVCFTNLFYRVFDTVPVENLLTLNAWDPQYAPIFISYSHSDKELVTEVVKELKSKGVRVMGDWEFNPGDSLISKISTAVSKAAYLIIVLSNDSVKSPWVNKELEIAISAELNGRNLKIIPVVIDNCEVPLFLSGSIYTDLRKWPNDSLQPILDTLKKWGRW